MKDHAEQVSCFLSGCGKHVPRQNKKKETTLCSLCFHSKATIFSAPTISSGWNRLRFELLSMRSWALNAHTCVCWFLSYISLFVLLSCLLQPLHVWYSNCIVSSFLIISHLHYTIIRETNQWMLRCILKYFRNSENYSIRSMHLRSYSTVDLYRISMHHYHTRRST